ncbi:temptin-like [Argopecten irradians]|uniref:temptin-like n=1 Tax=Argopecten irradians TaxID=31199 RepID=UPI003720405F
MLLQVFVSVLSLSTCLGFKVYEKQIPNGDAVPHPCVDGTLWNGVGHITSSGGGQRNLFGDAFRQNGHMWTLELCTDDTDLDGVPNGVELGDPSCVWTVGDTPAGPATGHPGICEPTTLQKCIDYNYHYHIDCRPVNG